MLQKKPRRRWEAGRWKMYDDKNRSIKLKGKNNCEVRHAPEEHASFWGIPFSEPAEVLLHGVLEDIAFLSVEPRHRLSMCPKPIVPP